MSVYSLITLDGTLALDEEVRTVALGSEPGVSVVGATATLETAGELSSRITASRLLLTGVFALAWRKKQDDRELYVTIMTDTTTMIARVDPKRGELTRRFVAAVNDVSAGRRVNDVRFTTLSRSDKPRTFAENMQASSEKFAAMTPEQRAANIKHNVALGYIAFGVIAFIIVFVIFLAIVH